MGESGFELLRRSLFFLKHTFCFVPVGRFIFLHFIVVGDFMCDFEFLCISEVFVFICWEVVCKGCAHEVMLMRTCS